jgi:hypothetical protein
MLLQLKLMMLKLMLLQLMQLQLKPMLLQLKPMLLQLQLGITLTTGTTLTPKSPTVTWRAKELLCHRMSALWGRKLCVPILQ